MHVAEAVVFAQGTAILIKTDETKKITDNKIDETGWGKWAWTNLGNKLARQFLGEVTDDLFEERKEFAINFARKYAMKLLYIPTGGRKIEVLV